MLLEKLNSLLKSDKVTLEEYHKKLSEYTEMFEASNHNPHSHVESDINSQQKEISLTNQISLKNEL